MNEVQIIETGFSIFWRCVLHGLSGRALSPMGNSFGDYEAAKRKNFCPECNGITKK